MNLIYVKHGEVVVGVGRLFLARSACTTACAGLSVGSECLQKQNHDYPDNPHTRLVSHLMIEDDGAREAKVRRRRRGTGRHGARRETRHDTKHSDAEGGVGGDVRWKRREGWGATVMSRARARAEF